MRVVRLRETEEGQRLDTARVKVHRNGRTLLNVKPPMVNLEPLEPIPPEDVGALIGTGH